MLPTDKKVCGESNRWCWIALALIIICSAVIRGRLAAIPLERDEGEYAYIAQQMLKGVPPYASAYSMKLPGIYAVYALILATFGQTDIAIHLGLAIVNVATIFVIFLLSRSLFGAVAGVVAACAYAVMSLGSSVLGLSANAEHFVILPALVGIWLIQGVVSNCRYGRLLSAGLLMGLAFVIKQHGIFFAVFGALYLLSFELRHRPIQWKRCIISQIVFGAGVVAPFAITCLLLWQAGVFEKFWFWTFIYAHRYAAMIPLSIAVHIFTKQFTYVAGSAVVIWLLALLGLVTVIVVKHYRRGAVFVVGLLVFSFLAICPGFYFRGHYFIFLLPAIAVLAGAGFDSFRRGLSKLPTWLSGYFCIERVIVFVGLAVVGFSLFQQRNYLFYNTPAEVCRLIYGGNPFPESLRIAEFIRANCADTDTVAVFGSEPQIYFYSGRRAATHYIYMYPLMEASGYAATMQKEMIGEIESSKPELMVFVRVGTSWLSRPDSAKLIFEWLNSYSPKFYDLVGVVDIRSVSQTIYRWDEQAKGYTPASEDWLTVYKRKH
jgi:4-amino-4-deoxy-L-arabinose transferase-like glycosyltransferase